jgi:sialate O-acetylesterase
MIQPHVPFAIKGAIWYQGESNAQTNESSFMYRQTMPALISSWRKVWGQGDFPFLFVQLPNFSRDTWPWIRESFVKTLELPKTGMAITIDIGDPKDIHPKNKQDVGKRLAMSALHVAYGKDIPHSGPIYESMKVDGNKIRLSFKYIFEGLEARSGDLAHFTIAGKDRKFVPAKAVIDGKCVVVSCDSVANPVAVRYAWSANPKCNLYNKARLPASPFRTDDWPYPSE